MIKKFFLNLLTVISYKFFIIKRLFKRNKKQLLTISEVKVGYTIDWADNFKEWAEKRYGAGSFKVLDIKENNLMTRRVIRSGELLNKTPLCFLIKICGGSVREKGERLWFEGDFFFGKEIFIYTKV
ncbi:MAG: hypothetical protein L3J07_01590 [Candidatus Magasanikbacteria bacterium]|nr:hypothetical protein [Candidatus Magasanikbacteria bacterium]